MCWVFVTFFTWLKVEIGFQIVEHYLEKLAAYFIVNLDLCEMFIYLFVKTMFFEVLGFEYIWDIYVHCTLYMAHDIYIYIYIFIYILFIYLCYC